MENFEPTPEEIIQHAMYLGMDPETEQRHLWIAKESLVTPVKEPWYPAKSLKDGQIYYMNKETSAVQKEHPSDE